MQPPWQRKYTMFLEATIALLALVTAIFLQPWRLLASQRPLVHESHGKPSALWTPLLAALVVVVSPGALEFLVADLTAAAGAPTSGKGVAAGSGAGGTYAGRTGPGVATAGSPTSAGFTTRATTRITRPPARTGMISFHSISGVPPRIGNRIWAAAR